MIKATLIPDDRVEVTEGKLVVEMDAVTARQLQWIFSHVPELIEAMKTKQIFDREEAPMTEKDTGQLVDDFQREIWNKVY